MIQVCHPVPPASGLPGQAAAPGRRTLKAMASPPPAPTPAADAGTLPQFNNLSLRDAPSPPAEEELDIMTMARETAMKLFVRSVLALANAAGEIPATPPVSRPRTPLGKENAAGVRSHRRTASRPATPVPAEREKISKTELEQPEAHDDEPTMTNDIGAGAEPEAVQRANMARKFYLKKVPAFGLEEYANRLQKFCPMSAGVWLAAGSYIHRLCVVERSVPLTHRTMHRLVIACLAVAHKALEDNRWDHQRLSMCGGLEKKALGRLELCVEFMLSFNLQFLEEGQLKEAAVALQRAGQAAMVSSKLPSSFNLTLPNSR